jgi:FkbM family methyltransferase
MQSPVLSLAAWLARRLPVPARQALYRVRPLANLIRRSLNRVAPGGWTEVEVAAGPLVGYRLLLDLQSEKDYWLGTYETDLQAAVTGLVKPGMLAYDVGANIGYVSLMLARAVEPGGGVFAFEALPANLARLARNVSLNGLETTVRVVPVAVADRNGPLEFLVGPSPGMGKAAGSAGRQEVNYVASILVEGLSLDSFVYDRGNPAPQVVKLDIEGGEVLALPGMRRLLAEAHPLILMEIHGPQAAQAAWEALTTADYRIYRMQAGYPQVTEVGKLGWKAYLVAWVLDPRGRAVH